MHQTSSLENPRAERDALTLRPVWWIRPRGKWAVVCALCAAVVLAELAGRAVGLHTPVLYEKTEYGFRPRPNQSIRRFGNVIDYDARGLRSAPVPLLPAAGTLRLLFIGDSIVNGGARVDQAATIPYLVQLAMSRPARTVEALNASSPGWAVSNAAGWFSRNGAFGAHYVVLVTNTFDLFQEEAANGVVGSHPAFPEHGPGLALIELFNRYLWPRLVKVEAFIDPGAEMNQTNGSITRRVLDDLRFILLRARAQGAIGVVVLVEPATPLSSSATTLGERALRDLRSELAGLDAPLIDTRDAVAAGGGAGLFRDGLHPTPAGNAVIAGVIAAELERAGGGRR